MPDASFPSFSINLNMVHVGRELRVPKAKGLTAQSKEEPEPRSSHTGLKASITFLHLMTAVAQML